jgi:hypothetical protein
MSKVETPSSVYELPLSIIKNMIGLSSSGFGVVVALAWNEVIKRAVTDFIDPYMGKNSGLISLFIYALVMTTLAVIATMQLSSMQKNLELLAEKFRNNQKRATVTKLPNKKTATK